MPAAWRFTKALEWAAERTEPFTVKIMAEDLLWEKPTVSTIIAELRSRNQLRLVGVEPTPGSPRRYIFSGEETERGAEAE